MRERGAEKPEVAGAALTCAGRYSIKGSDRDSVDQSNCSVLDFVMWRLDYEALSCAGVRILAEASSLCQRRVVDWSR